MFYILMGLVCGVVGSLPLFLIRRNIPAIGLFVVGSVGSAFELYLSTPSTVYPLFGAFGFMVFLLWVVGGVIVFFDEEREGKWPLLFPAGAMFLYMLFGFASCSMFNAAGYSSMLGEVETRTWTQDVQPKDPKHMRMSSRENSFYNAKKRIGEAGAIGSQFQILEDRMTLQMIKGELWYVAPLDFASFSTWTASKGVPGYVMVHGEDPHREPVLKLLEDSERYRYTLDAYFGDNLERHMRSHGYLNYGFAEFQFEVDEAGKGWWVVSTFEPTIGWSGEKVTGAAIVDPVTGAITHYSLGDVPDWVDRVIPSEIIKNYVDWRGHYHLGWWNSFWSRHSLTEAEEPNLIYGSEGQPDWVTGVTSTNENDESLINLIYTNSRTGKSVMYNIGGGSTDAATVDAVNKNSEVQFKHLHGVSPQLYNVYGTMASVVPLLSENHAFQGVAIADIRNIQTIAVGRDQHDALRVFESMQMQTGQQVALDKTSKTEVVEGVVDRFSSEIISDKTIYYVHIDGLPHLFTGGSGELSPKLPVTKIGDKVKVEYVGSDRDVVPMRSFDNLSLPLVSSTAQKEVRQRSADRREQEQAASDQRTVAERLKDMSPEELKRLKGATSPPK